MHRSMRYLFQIVKFCSALRHLKCVDCLKAAIRKTGFRMKQFHSVHKPVIIVHSSREVLYLPVKPSVSIRQECKRRRIKITAHTRHFHRLSRRCIQIEFYRPIFPHLHRLPFFRYLRRKRKCLLHQRLVKFCPHKKTSHSIRSSVRISYRMKGSTGRCGASLPAADPPSKSVDCRHCMHPCIPARLYQNPLP